MICSPGWLTVLVPTRMFLLLVVVCSSWMQYMWISVSAHALCSVTSPMVTVLVRAFFAELGYSFSTAASCLLPGLISVSGSVFCFLFSSTFLLGLAKTKGLGLCLNLIWVWQSFSWGPFLYCQLPKKSGVRFSPIHLTSTTVDQLPIVQSNHGEKCCPFNTVACRELGLQMFPAFCFSSFPMLLNTFSRHLGEKKVVW